MQYLKEIAAIIFHMIIFLVTSAVVIIGLHNFLMRSVDNYTGYGNGRRDWERFQASKLDGSSYNV